MPHLVGPTTDSGVAGLLGLPEKQRDLGSKIIEVTIDVNNEVMWLGTPRPSSGVLSLRQVIELVREAFA